MEQLAAKVDQNTEMLDKKIDSAVEMLSLQITRAMERFDLSNRDKFILGIAPPTTHQFQHSNFRATSSQTPFSPGLGDLRPTRTRTESEHTSSYSVNAASYRFDFPRFDGTYPRSWLLKALNYFKIMNIQDEDRVVIASMHFDGPAMEWFYQISMESREVSWTQFMDLVSSQFGELKEAQVIIHCISLFIYS